MLIMLVERHLRNTGMAPTTFGRQAIGDPRLVGDLRNGRQPRHATEQRILAHMASHYERQAR